MKKAILILSILVLSFSLGCSSEPTSAAKSEQEPSGEKHFESYYDKLKEDINHESYVMLTEIYDTYGIEIRFDKTMNESEPKISKTYELPKEKYDLAIERIYEILNYYGDDKATVELLSDIIDSFYCVDSITFEGDNSYSVTSSFSSTITIAILDTDSYNKSTKMSDLGGALSWLILGRYDIYDVDFVSNNTNGFIDYDDKVETDDEEYLKILKSYDIYGDDQEQELLKAGILSPYGVERVGYDFQSYFTGLLGNRDDFWDKYSSHAAVNKKTNEAVKYLNSINPKWTFEYFVELSHPDGLDALSELKSLDLDITSDIIGIYSGTYQNNSGEMNVDIEIFEVDKNTGDAKAKFVYSPGDGNDSAKSGAYYMTGNIDLDNGEFYLNGSEWITEKPKKYNMFDLTGTIIGNKFKAKIDRDYLQDFVLTKLD